MLFRTLWTQDLPALQHPVAPQAHRLPRHLGPAVQRLLTEDEVASRYVPRGGHDPFSKMFGDSCYSTLMLIIVRNDDRISNGITFPFWRSSLFCMACPWGPRAGSPGA